MIKKPSLQELIDSLGRLRERQAKIVAEQSRLTQRLSDCLRQCSLILSSYDSHGKNAVAFFVGHAMKTLHVLIVEDYADTAELLATWVKLAGHDACVCNTAFQAKEALPEFHPDVVLLDIGLPDMDGWELAPLLRGDNAALRIFALTAYQSFEDRQKSKDAGIDLHVGKPVGRETVRRLLDLVAN